MTEILITGGAGNFGRSLAVALREKNHALRILDLPACDFGFFEGWERTRIFTGDILEPDTLRPALDGVELVFHLAAILPPASEIDRAGTFRVNVDGTRNLLETCTSCGLSPRIIFASSVSVYGDTHGEKDPIKHDHPVNPIDLYAESKIEAEKVLIASGLAYVNLRISGIVIPEFLDPPEPWAFMRDQPIELLPLGDLVYALAQLVDTEEALNRTLLLAGGPDWQVLGEEYVQRWGEIMEIPLEDMDFMQQPGWLNRYDTKESRELLGYQRTSMYAFFKELEIAVDEALA